MNREKVMEYLRKSLDKNLEETMRRKLGSYTYYDTFDIRCDVKEFEEVMQYIKENLK